jgi:hypothetical protein
MTKEKQLKLRELEAQSTVLEIVRKRKKLPDISPP